MPAAAPAVVLHINLATGGTGVIDCSSVLPIYEVELLAESLSCQEPSLHNQRDKRS